MSSQIVECDYFAKIEGNERSQVFEYYPKSFSDNRGFFSEILKQDSDSTWFFDLSWMKQINRSSSSANTFRGFHAQTGSFCQAKLVENLSKYMIYDIICDARPESSTFGKSKIFCLNPYDSNHNMLFVPRGFLHSFFVPKRYLNSNGVLENIESQVIFQYYCDNVYDKSSETGVSPKTLLKDIISYYQEIGNELNDDAFKPLLDSYNSELVLSEKDLKAEDYKIWMKEVQENYQNRGVIWYK